MEGIDDATQRLRTRAERLTERLEAGRSTGVVVATVRRFFSIEGLDLAGLLGIELFTTILPLILIGYSWFTHFNSVSLGEVIIRHLGLHDSVADAMRAAFSQSMQLQSIWTIAGLAGWLLWGIPMSIQVAKTYALAWRRDRFGTVEEAVRGYSWFLLYIGVLAVKGALSPSLAPGAVHLVAPGTLHLLTRIAMLVPSFVVWAVAPIMLVRDGKQGWRHLWVAGAAGVLIDSIIMNIAGRIVMQPLLKGWEQFGSIGMAMGLMTWSIVLATAWVVTAVVGAVLWERTAPVATVVEAQTDERAGSDLGDDADVRKGRRR